MACYKENINKFNYKCMKNFKKITEGCLVAFIVTSLVWFSFGIARADNSSGSGSPDSSTGGSSSSVDSSSASSGSSGSPDSSTGGSSSSDHGVGSGLSPEVEREHASAVSGSSAIEMQIQSLEKSREAATSSEAVRMLDKQIKALELQNERLHQLSSILDDSRDISSGDVSKVLSSIGTSSRDLEREQKDLEHYTMPLIGTSTATDTSVNVLNNFITYGSRTSIGLGEGERAGVVSSFVTAFGRLPSSGTDWADVLKIASGRTPMMTSSSSESRAEELFNKVYHRTPDLTDAHDKAAVGVMAYGLRPDHRNLSSEQTAIATFKRIYERRPTTAIDWNEVRAIAYSGAIR